MANQRDLPELHSVSRATISADLPLFTSTALKTGAGLHTPPLRPAGPSFFCFVFGAKGLGWGCSSVAEEYRRMGVWESGTWDCLWDSDDLRISWCTV